MGECMKTVSKKLYQRILNLGFAFVLTLSSVTTGLSFALSQTVAAAPGIVENTDTSEVFTSIQDAIDDTETLNGHTIFVQNGTYDENLDVSKSLTIEGESQAGVVVVANDGGYGIENTVDGLDLFFKNLTLLDSLHYGFKLTGSDAVLENVTARNSSRTEFDFNGMLSVHLKNVRAYGENTSGNGFSFTNSDNITIDGIVTRDNNWGGTALYPYGAHYPVGIDNVHIAGVNANEANPLYIQVGAGGTPVTNFTASQFKYIVTNDEFRADGSQFTLYQKDLNKATNFARSLHLAPNVPNVDSVITRVSDDVKFVPTGLQLADAVEAVADGGTIRVLNGEHAADDAQIVIDKDVRIIGNSTANTVLKLQHDTASSGDNRSWFRVTSDNKLTLQKMTLDGNGKVAYVGVLFQSADGDLRNLNFTGIKAQDSGSPYQGSAVRAEGEGTVSVRNSSFNETGRIGIHYAGSTVGGNVLNNEFNARGNGDWLDYAMQISTGGTVVANKNTFVDHTGFVTPWGSGAILVAATASGSGATVKLNGNTFQDNTMGLAVQDADSTVVARNNVFRGNDWAVVNYYANPLVDARKNYWGSNTGPNDTHVDASIPVLNETGEGDKVYGAIRYDDWNTQEVPAPVLLSPSNNTPINGTTPISNDWEDVTGVSIQHYTYQSYNVLADGSCDVSSIRWTENYTNSETNSRTLADGLQYCWRVKVVDNDGNESTWSDLWKTVVDNIAPTVALTNPANGSLHNGPVELRGTVEDANPHHYWLQIKKDGSVMSIPGVTGTRNDTTSFTDKLLTTLTEEGDYEVTLAARDAVGGGSSTGNRSGNEVINFTIDTTAPVINSVKVMQDGNDISDGITNDRLITVEWSSDDSDVDFYEYKNASGWHNKGGDTSFTGNIGGSSANADGTYTYCVRATDHAGNTGSEVCASVTLDETAPVVSITPLSGAYGFISGVDIDADIDADAVSYQVLVNGVEVASEPAPFVTYALPVVDGTYDIQVEATDAAGNVGVSPVSTITVDNTAPVLTVGGYTGTSLTPTITGTTNGVDDVVTVDGVLATVDTVVNGDGTYDWTYTFPTQTIGTHTIAVVSTDTYGNEITVPGTITVEAVPATETTPATTSTTVTPDPDNATTNTDDQEVLGAQTEGDDSGTSTVSEDILGTADQKDSEWTIFGLAWYWWLLILAGLTVLARMLYALWRRRSEENA